MEYFQWSESNQPLRPPSVDWSAIMFFSYYREVTRSTFMTAQVWSIWHLNQTNLSLIMYDGNEWLTSTNNILHIVQITVTLQLHYNATVNLFIPFVLYFPSHIGLQVASLEYLLADLACLRLSSTQYSIFFLSIIFSYNHAVPKWREK